MNGRRTILAGAVRALAVPVPVLPSTAVPCPAAAMLPAFAAATREDAPGPSEAMEEAVSWVRARSLNGALLQVLVARGDAMMLHASGEARPGGDAALACRIDRLLWSALPVLAAAASVPVELVGFYRAPWVNPMSEDQAS